MANYKNIVKASLKEKLEKMKGMTLSYNQFERFLGSLMDLGFFISNGSENIVADYIGYKMWRNISEYSNDYAERIIIEYIKEYINGDIRIHIKDVEYIR
jgi:hypothetical protein